MLGVKSNYRYLSWAAITNYYSLLKFMLQIVQSLPNFFFQILKPSLENFSIYSNNFYHNFHLPKSSFSYYSLLKFMLQIAQSSRWAPIPKPKTSKTLFGPVNFSDFFKNCLKINSRIWFWPVNSNFHFGVFCHFSFLMSFK
jgi:hypothetical protein